MSEQHYSGHDPETGCGLMIVLAAVGLIVVVAVIVWMLVAS